MSKRGRLSDEEMDFISKNLDQTDNFIADRLNRQPDTIAKYRLQLQQEANVAPKLQEQRDKFEEAKLMLRAKPNWEDIKLQYSEQELKLVEYHWVMLYQQFKEDMTHTEELQIFKLINLEVMIDRNMKQKASVEREMERIEELLDDLYKKDKQERTPMEEQTLMQLEQELKFSRSSQQARNTEYTKLLEKHENILKGLKSTRADRLKDTESSNETFFGLIKAFANDAYFRDTVSKNIELYKMGMKKEEERLTAPHKYMDGDVDLPILSAETYTRSLETE